MSSVKLDFLIDEFPEEQEAVGRLQRFIDSCLESGPSVREVTIQRIFDIVHPSTQRILVKMLMRMVEHGMMDKIIRIESDARGGIGDDYKSVMDIPNVMFDRRLGHEIEVRPDQIRTIYSIHRLPEAR
jgi:hypothetical protein